MNYIQQLNANVTQWFDDRGLITDANPIAQLSKLTEEIGEVCEAIDNRNFDNYRLEIGDCMVVINGLCNQLRIDPNSVIFDAVIDGSPRYEFDQIIPCINLNSRKILVSMGQLAESINKGRDATEALRSVYFNVQHFATVMNIIPSECYALVYAKIKNRKGVMRDGIYVKEEDI